MNSYESLVRFTSLSDLTDPLNFAEAGSPSTPVDTEPNGDIRSLNSFELASFRLTVDQFIHGNEWAQNDDICRLLRVMVEDQPFRASMDCEAYCLKDIAGIGINSASDMSGLLCSLLAKPEHPTKFELDEFKTLLRGELKTNHDKWAVKLAGALRGDVRLEESIRQRLNVVEEYDKNHHNPTFHGTLQLNKTWLTMKNRILVSPQEVLAIGCKEKDVLRVPPEVRSEVKQAQESIKAFEAVIKEIWTPEREDRASDGLADRMNEVIHHSGAALAESMTTLCSFAAEETTGKLYTLHEEAVLRVMAANAMEIAKRDGGMMLLEGKVREEMLAFLEKKPSDESRQAKMIDLLARQFREGAEKNEYLQQRLTTATYKAVDAYRKSRKKSLLKSTEVLQHALEKSKRLRVILEREAGKKSPLKALTDAMQRNEDSLNRALYTFSLSQPDWKQNLKTARDLIRKSYADANFENGVAKAVDGFIAGFHSAGKLMKKAGVKLDKALHIPVPGKELPKDKLSELSTLMVTLDSVADLATSFSEPFVASTASLKRIRHKVNTSATTELQLKREVKSTTNSDMMLEAMLDVSLADGAEVRRRVAKQHDLEEKVAIQLTGLQKVLPHIREQLGVTFENRIADMYQTFGVHKDDYLSKVQSLRHHYLAKFTQLEKQISDAARPERKGDERAAKELFAAANSMTALGKNLSREIRSISELDVGIKFGYNSYDKNIVQDLMSFAAQQCGEEFEAWMEAEPDKRFRTSDVTAKMQRIVRKIQSQLMDPDRTIMRRAKDPQNALLNAALEQELRNMMNRVQDKAATLDQLLAQTPNISDIVRKKLYQKAVTGTIFGVLSAVTSLDPLTEILASASRATELIRILWPTKYKTVADQLNQWTEASSKRKAVEKVGQRHRPHAMAKLKQRELVKAFTNIISVFVPAVVTVPFTLPFALYGMATRPEKFIKSVVSELPLSLAIALGYEAYSETVELHQDVLRDKQDHNVEHIKDDLRRCRKNPEKLDVRLKAYDKLDPTFQRAVFELNEEFKKEEKFVREDNRELVAEAEKARKEFEAKLARNNANLRGEVGKKIEGRQTEVHPHGVNDHQVTDNDKVMPSDGDGRIRRRVKRNTTAVVNAIPASVENNITENTVTTPQKSHDEMINESINGAIIESVPDADKGNLIHDSQAWIDDYNTNWLKKSGFQPPAETGKFDWERKVDIYYSAAPKSAAPHDAIRDRYDDDEKKGTITFREYAVGEHLRKGWGLADDLVARPPVNDPTFTKMLDALKETNLQEDYLGEIAAYYNRPEVKEYAEVLYRVKLKAIIRDHFIFSVKSAGYNLEDVRARIERGEVYTLSIGGQNISDMVCIKRNDSNGYLFVSLYDGKVFEVNWHQKENVIEFNGVEQATEWYARMKAGLPLKQLKSVPTFKMADDGAILNIKDVDDRFRTEAHEEILEMNTTSGFSDRLLEFKSGNLKSDVDYLIKSSGEQYRDKVIDIIGKVGTLISVLLIPVTGGLGGLGMGVGAKLATFISSAAFSWLVTIGAGVLPRIYQGIKADRTEDEQSALFDIYIALLTEGAGHLLGELLSTIKNNALKNLAKYLKCAPEDVPAHLKTKLFDRIANKFKRFSKEGDLSIDNLASGTGTPSSRLSVDSGKSFGSGPEYAEFKFIDEGLELPEAHIKKVTGDFDNDIEQFKKLYGIPGNTATPDELKYRTMAWILNNSGYKVQVGTVTVTTSTGSTSKNLVLKISKPGKEDGYIYFKNGARSGSNGSTGNVFNESHGAKIFKQDDFVKSYASDMGLDDNFVKVQWGDLFSGSDSLTKTTEIVNSPAWVKDKAIESLAGKSSLASKTSVPAKPGYDSVKAGFNSMTSHATIEFFSYLGSQVKSGVSGKPYSFSDLRTEVYKPDATLRFTNTLGGTITVGTSLHLLGPAASGNTNNVTIYNYSGGKAVTANISYNSNTQVNLSVGDAGRSSGLNYEYSKKRIKGEAARTNDQDLVNHENRIKTSLGTSTDISRLNAPIIIVIDKSKIPNLQPGNKMPSEIPNEAIVGIITEEDKVQEVSVIAEKLLGRKVPVTPLKVEKTPEALRTEQEAAQQINTVSVADPEGDNNASTTEGYSSLPGDNLSRLGRKFQSRYPNESDTAAIIYEDNKGKLPVGQRKLHLIPAGMQLKIRRLPDQTTEQNNQTDSRNAASFLRFGRPN